MAKTKAQIIAEAQVVKNATEVGENTATRVGTVLEDLADADGMVIIPVTGTESGGSITLSSNPFTQVQTAVNAGQHVVVRVTVGSDIVDFTMNTYSDSIATYIGTANFLMQEFQMLCNSSAATITNRSTSNTFSTGESVPSVGIDTTPTQGSNNLITSGAVENSLSNIPQIEVVNNIVEGGSTKALSAEQGKILGGGLNKAFDNWNTPDEILATATGTSASWMQSNVPVSVGEHIVLNVKNGTGTYTFYVYYTSANNPKDILGTCNGNDTIDIPSFSLGSYQSYYRLFVSGSSSADFTLIRKTGLPISFGVDLTQNVNGLISAALMNYDSKFDEYSKAKEITLLNSITTDTNIHKVDIGVDIGDYIKVVAGNGTTGTWGLAKYDDQHNVGKMMYFEDLAPNESRNVKIINNYYRLFFYIVDSCDAPLSVYKLSYLNNKILDVDNETDVNYSYYYDKGNSPKMYNAFPCIIVGGQSNAEGRVPASDLPADITLPDSNVKVWNGSDFVDLSTSYFSGGKWAFDTITAHYLGQITQCFFVKYTKGATHLVKRNIINDESWTADYEGVGNSLLRILEDRVRNAEAANSTFSIRAMLWHQGEGDATPDTIAVRYYDALKKFIAYIRGVVGNARLPFISGTISHFSDSYNSIVEAAQLRVAAEDPYVTYIDMSGAPLMDSYHFNAASSEYFGKMAYDCLIDYGVVTGTKLNPPKPW